MRVVETSTEFMVVAWDAPESDGGTAITKYKVRTILCDGNKCIAVRKVATWDHTVLPATRQR